MDDLASTPARRRADRADRAGRAARRRRQRLCAGLALALPAVVVVTATLAALRVAAPPWIRSAIERERNTERFLDPLYERIRLVDERSASESAGTSGAPESGQPTVALVGDSIVWEAEASLRSELATGTPPLNLLAITTAMLRPIHYVYLLDEIARAAPDVALLEVNVAWMGMPAVVDRSWQRRLARKLALDRAARLAPAIASGGELASPLDPVLYRGEEKLGLLFFSDGVRLAVSEKLSRLGTRVQRSFGMAVRASPRSEFPLEWTAEVYAREFAETATVPLLGEVAAALRAAHIAVVFFVPPIDEAALADRAGEPAARADLSARIDRLRHAVGARKEEWLDLHALVPPGEFRDPVGHLTPAGYARLARILAAVSRARR